MSEINGGVLTEELFFNCLYTNINLIIYGSSDLTQKELLMEAVLANTLYEKGLILQKRQHRDTFISVNPPIISHFSDLHT